MARGGRNDKKTRTTTTLKAPILYHKKFISVKKEQVF